MKSTTITTNTKTLQYVSGRLVEIAEKMHIDALAAYPDVLHQTLDSGSLDLRNCKLHVDLAIKQVWAQLNGYLLEAELDRLEARIKDLEDFFIKALDTSKLDLQEALLSLFNDRLTLKRQIQDLTQKSTDFSLPDFVVDRLVEFNFINRGN